VKKSSVEAIVDDPANEWFFHHATIDQLAAFFEDIEKQSGQLMGEGNPFTPGMDNPYSADSANKAMDTMPDTPPETGTSPMTTRPRQIPSGGGDGAGGAMQGFAAYMPVRCTDEGCDATAIVPTAKLALLEAPALAMHNWDLDESVSDLAIEAILHEADGGSIERTRQSLDGQLRDAAAAQGVDIESKTVSDQGGRLVYLLDGVEHTPGEAADKLGVQRWSSERFLRGASLHTADSDEDAAMRMPWDRWTCPECGMLMSVPDKKHMSQDQCPNCKAIAKKDAKTAATSGDGPGYYVLSGQAKVAGPYATPSEAFAHLLEAHGTAVEYVMGGQPAAGQGQGETFQNPSGYNYRRPVDAMGFAGGAGYGGTYDAIDAGRGGDASIRHRFSSVKPKISRLARWRKVREIAATVQHENPGLSPAEARAVASETVDEFPEIFLRG
jgi:predicted nucleic acid-binding Zn ribbon protein